jgi:predicted nucleic acid-binding protein
MRVIVDTHLFIYREYENALPKELQKLLAIFNKFGIKIFAHPFSLQEIERDANLKNPQVILSKVKTYPVIDNPPDVNTDDEFLNIVGLPEDPRDDTDNQLLYCVYKNVEDYLITEDRDIQRKSQKIKISDRVFGLKEALDYFNDQHNDTVPRFQGQLPDAETPASEQVQAANDSSIPRICFLREGDYWRVGQLGKHKFIKHTNGFNYIHFMLKFPYENFKPEFIYNLGENFLSERDDISDQELIEDLGVDGAFSEPKLDEEGVALYKSTLSHLKGNLKNLKKGDQEKALIEKVKIEKQIKVLKSQLIGRKERSPKSESIRTSIYKAIFNIALKNIYKELPEIENYLNRHTIWAKDDCSYRPILNDTPHWILHPET